MNKVVTIVANFNHPNKSSEISEKSKVRIGYVSIILIFLIPNAFDCIRIGYDLDSHIYIPESILGRPVLIKQH